MAKYYSEIAEFILPYLKDRPQNMNRHPDGIHGESFYHKDYEAKHPDFVKIFDYHSESTNEIISHIVCNNIETLMYLVNLGCIEINPWNSRIQTIDKPDYLVLDLDPDTSFEVVIDVALKLHDILDKYELPNYVKTSGIKGLHIYLPLSAQYNYEQVRTFAELLGKLVQKELPNLVTLERDPDKRKGKVYIDYLQNRIGQTTVAAYSLRPIKEASVSCPLEWKEIRKGLRIEEFTMDVMVKRLMRKGDIWKPVLGKRKDFKGVLKNFNIN